MSSSSRFARRQRVMLDISLGQERDPGVKPPLLELDGLVPDDPRMAAGQESLLLRWRDETECEGLHFFHIGYSTWSHGQVNRTQAQKDIAKNHSYRDRPAVRALLTALKAWEVPHGLDNFLNFGFLCLEGALFCHKSAEEFPQRVWYLQK